MTNPIAWLRAYFQRPRCPVCRKRKHPKGFKFAYGACSIRCFVEAQKLTFAAAMIGVDPWKAAAEQS